MVYFAVAILITWPAAASLGEVVPGAARTDAWNSLWSLGHWAEALSQGQVPWRVDTLNFPRGGDLLISDPMGATLVTPFVMVFGHATAFTLLVWLQLTLAGLVLHCFCQEFLLWRRGGGELGFGPWVSGLSIMVAPLVSSHLHNGATEALSIGPTVFSIWMFWRAAIAPCTRHTLYASVALALAAAFHGYGGVVAGVFGLALAVVGPGGDGYRWSLQRWLPIAVACVLTGGMMAGMAMIHHAEGALIGIKSVAQVGDVLRSTGAADPLSYFVPGAHWSPDFRVVSRHDERFMHVHYLGYLLIALAVWTQVRRRRHTGFVVLGGAVCLMLSLGPVLIHQARPLIISGSHAVPLPFFLLESLPGFNMMSLTWKLALGPVIALSMLAGLACDTRGRRMALIAMVGLTIEAKVLSPAAGLFETVSTVPEASLLALRAAPEGAVINYPLQPGRPYLMEQAVHGKPLAGMLNQVANTQAMRLWARIRAESQSDPDTFHRAVSSTAERLGIRYLVIHTDPNAEPDRYTAAVVELERLFGVPDWGRGQTRVVVLW